MSGPLAAVVTGAGSGIGAAVVRKLLEHNPQARVAGIDIRFAELPEPGDAQFRPIVADLRRATDVRQAVADTADWPPT